MGNDLSSTPVESEENKSSVMFPLSDFGPLPGILLEYFARRFEQKADDILEKSDGESLGDIFDFMAFEVRKFASDLPGEIPLLDEPLVDPDEWRFRRLHARRGLKWKGWDKVLGREP